MNWDQIQKNWNDYKTKLKTNFDKLTNDDIDTINGRREQFLGKLQERYGYSRDVAEQKLNDFVDRVQAMGGKEGKKPEKV